MKNKDIKLSDLTHLKDSWYEKYYNFINVTARNNSFSHKILHTLIEKPFKTNLNYKILEVGAHNGEHLKFVKSNYSKYIMTDLQINLDPTFISEFDNRLSFRLGNVESLPFRNNTFDRVIVTCLMHHVDDPFSAFQELRRVAKNSGYISVLIPNDPGIMYRFLRSLTTSRRAKKANLFRESNFIHALEHRNHFLQLRVLLEEVFIKDLIKVSAFPFIYPSYNINALTCFHITKISK